ncbi:Ig-like domain-containing protein [Enterovibrio nigricans]|uniref:Ig-like domain (Group 2) n=1 Tax=Enterovibrio nigricans DSM 22720 TaxID=1121868 RepID=A0A1T4UW48_9GAMM|nr:Ig-like domain-containing protein [Enterovibrio nigricans]SKA56651.1 Ig-like domain (group 2) [Enterovibrio nigricans DSM 22720]
MDKNNEQRIAQLDNAFAGALDDLSHSVISLGGHSRILLNRSGCEESIVLVIASSMALGGIASEYNKLLGKESTFSASVQALFGDAVKQAIAGNLKSMPPRELSDEEFDAEMKKRLPESYDLLSSLNQHGGDAQSFLASLAKEPSIDVIESELIDGSLPSVDLNVSKQDAAPLTIGFNCDDAQYLLDANDAIGSTIALPVDVYNPHNQSVKFETSDPTVLRVNEATGELTAVKVGSATITATLSKKGDHKRIQSSLDVLIDG